MKTLNVSFISANCAETIENFCKRLLSETKHKMKLPSFDNNLEDFIDGMTRSYLVVGRFNDYAILANYLSDKTSLREFVSKYIPFDAVLGKLIEMGKKNGYKLNLSFSGFSKTEMSSIKDMLGIKEKVTKESEPDKNVVPSETGIKPSVSETPDELSKKDLISMLDELADSEEIDIQEFDYAMKIASILLERYKSDINRTGDTLDMSNADDVRNFAITMNLIRKLENKVADFKRTKELLENRPRKKYERPKINIPKSATKAAEVPIEKVTKPRIVSLPAEDCLPLVELFKMLGL